MYRDDAPHHLICEEIAEVSSSCFVLLNLPDALSSYRSATGCSKVAGLDLRQAEAVASTDLAHATEIYGERHVSMAEEDADINEGDDG